MGTLPTVDDVAALAGVSRQTVSNVLNSPDIVRPATRERVADAVARLGYRPHASARRLRTQKSSTIGIRLDPMLNGISGSVHDRFLHALTERAATRGMRIMLFTATSRDDEIEQFRRLRDGADVDAFVLTSVDYDDSRTEWLIANDVPFVSFGRPWGIDDLEDSRHVWVDVDGRAGVSAATEAVVAGGARRIGFIGFSEDSAAGNDRRLGWMDVLRARFGTGDADLAADGIRLEDTLSAARQAITDAVARDDLADAYVCASDTLALGALMALTAAGRSDVPIIGFDNTPVAAAVGLSSIEQRLDDVAAGALDLLLGPSGSSILDPREPRPETHRLITPELVLRHPNELAAAAP